MADTVHDDETIEDLQLNGLRLIQKKGAFRFGMDSVLLAHFADIRENDTVADIGTGNGVLVLLLRGRNKGSRYWAVEIQKEAAELAERNMALNGLEEKCQVLNINAADLPGYVDPCSVDAVICNPPYGQPSAALASPMESRALARNQSGGTLDQIFTGAFRVLKGKGKIFLIYPAPQALYVMKSLQEHHLEPKKIQMVYPGIRKSANLVLIEAVKDAKPTLHPMPPLIIYEEDGSLTNDLKSVYHI